MNDPIYATFSEGAVRVSTGPGNYRTPGREELNDMQAAIEMALQDEAKTFGLSVARGKDHA